MPRVRFDRLLIQDRAWTFSIDGGAPLPRAFSLPRDADSQLERRLAKDIRRTSDGSWNLVRESTVIRVGQRLFFPDFALHSARGRVLVEVVGYWTPEYLAAKAEALRAVDVPMVVCVDARHGPLDARLDVLPYSKVIDAEALLARADAVLRRDVQG